MYNIIKYMFINKVNHINKRFNININSNTQSIFFFIIF